VLGTGPSINQLDLSPLKDELCISVNSFFLHDDCTIIKPNYHLASGLGLHPKVPDEAGANWYVQMEQSIGDAIILLNYVDRGFVEENDFFLKHYVHYLCYGESWDHLYKGGVDASQLLYPARNVIVMVIQAAIYMGFRDIILLGVDHDWFIRAATQRQTHFYSDSESVIEKQVPFVEVDWLTEFKSHAALWKQYEILENYTRSNGVSIYNATPGGILDTFERVEYETLVRKSETPSAREFSSG
jgi:hypothetical protein